MVGRVQMGGWQWRSPRWSGLFGFGRGVRGEGRATAYLVGVILCVRGLVGFGQVCSGLFRVFGVGFGLRPIWSGRFCGFGGWSDLVGFVRVWSGWVSGWGLSDRGDSACSGSGRIWSGLFGFGRGVWGGRWALAGLLFCCGRATVSGCGVECGAARREVLRTGVGGCSVRCAANHRRMGPKSSLGRRILEAGMTGRGRGDGGGGAGV